MVTTRADVTTGLQRLLTKTRSYIPDDQIGLIEEAYSFAEASHAGQLRRSGEPYMIHPLDAALTIADLQLDAVTVAAALLHDVQEDCGVPNQELKRRFGAEVAHLVDGATKLEHITKQSSEPQAIAIDKSMQAENVRKMFLAMAEDVRVVIVKLADRLHNMRTLEHVEPDKRLRVAQETMEIYAPLASRLGIWQIKWELEDLAFQHLQPEKYQEIAQLIASKRTTRERYVARVEKILQEELAKLEIEAVVQGRAKHIYSVYQKMRMYAAQGKTFNEIHDLLALRVLVNSVADCYAVLGTVHGLWRPIAGEFDDYIASPREDVYQSLHTTVMCVDHRPLEVQIRTHEMHELAEYGVAAHWRYKEGAAQDVRFEERLSWLRRLLEWQRDIAHAEEFVEALKTDVFQDQVFVYTPNGEIKDLPAGATAIDFAYRIHTDLGHHCVGSKVNGRLVALNQPLQNGDVVEILKGRSSRGPSRDWLNRNLGYVKTSHARQKIRQWFRKQERAENIEKGRELLEKELRRLGVTLAECKDELLRQSRYKKLDDIYAALGFGELSLHQTALRLERFLAPEAPALTPTKRPAKTSYATPAIQVLGTGDLLTQLGRCCSPVPGDDIIGYVTRSRGVTVHRRDCFNVLHEDEKQRLVEVEWGRTGDLYPVAVQIEAWDRVALLRDIATIIAEEKVNMVAVRTEERDDGTTAISLTLETQGVNQLSRLLSKFEMVRGVISATRHVPDSVSQNL
ncbi:MAG: bifunctional (p)ppGpp synthetase/guanosine-3',5'-bis(diphosphate) 3'-pyrophosphohydrolase [Chloroflexi bacterium]|nr:bifunctional (p)ppGpp synthetase/guanosine-3',5'-bis(diphosphate) 3'-pyrophosphohydrolase [Chloroflexota bacterium]